MQSTEECASHICGSGDDHGCGCTHDHDAGLFRKDLVKSVFAGILVIIAVAIEYLDPLVSLIPVILSIIVLALTALPIFSEAYRGLRKGERNVNELVSIGILGAVILGEFTIAAEISVILTIGELAESWAYARSKRDIEEIIVNNPRFAHRVRNNALEEVPVDEIVSGEILLVRPGDIVPVDGIIMDGCSRVDESCLTGESLPVTKGMNDPVFSGSVNHDGTLTIRAEKTADNSAYAGIVRLVHEAGSRRPPTRLFIDRFSRVYTPIILGIAGVVLVTTGDPIRAITVLIVSCPCALLLATPSAVLAVIGSAAKRGILIRGGEFLEICPKISMILFDKTGTLTSGVMEVSSLQPAPGISRDDLLKTAGIAECTSSHPIAQAISRRCQALGIPLSCGGERVMHPGRGVLAFPDNEPILVGNRDFLQSSGVLFHEEPDTEENSAEIEVLVAKNQVFLGSIRVTDAIRPESAEVIRNLREFGIKKIGMITGDTSLAVSRIAGQSGINDDIIHSGVLPGQKQHIIDRFQKSGEKICFIGDGTNDGPALAQADIGVSIGSRSDTVALKTAPVVLMKDGLEQLPVFIGLGNRTSRVISVNVFMALGLNLLMILAAGAGWLSPAAGAIGHQVATIAVLFNSAAISFGNSRYRFTPSHTCTDPGCTSCEH